MKHCNGCDKTKELSEFSRRSDRPSGVQSRCKVCHKSYMDAHRGEQRARVTKRHHKRKEEDKEYVAKRRLSAANWKSCNRARVNKTWCTRNKERRATDVSYKLKRILRSRLQGCVRANKAGRKQFKKAGSAVADRGCSVEELTKYLENLFKTGMCWENHGSEWQIDHITPLASFDLTNREQFLKACHYSNLQPLWNTEHKQKTIQDLLVISHARSIIS